MPTHRDLARALRRGLLHRAAGKYVIAVNDDIDPEQRRRALWAMSYRANPALDIDVLPHRDQGHGPRAPQRRPGRLGADRRHAEGDFPPISLPKREYMEKAKKIWEELGLPKLKPEVPWFGYSLGEWSEDLDEAAARAVRGDYFDTGALLVKAPAQGRRHEHRSPAREGSPCPPSPRKRGPSAQPRPSSFRDGPKVRSRRAAYSELFLDSGLPRLRSLRERRRAPRNDREVAASA
jgi:hypothetical protein